MVLLISFMFAAYEDIQTQKILLETSVHNSNLNIIYSHNENSSTNGFYPSVLPAAGYIKQKIVIKDSEKSFYNMNFNDGVFVVDNNNVIYGVSTPLIEQYKNDFVGFGGGYETPIEQYFSSLSNKDEFTVNIPLNKITNPSKITGIVAIYGTNTWGPNLLDFYSYPLSFGSQRSMNSQRTCEISYIPIEQVKIINNSQWLLIPDVKKVKTHFLGDGVIVSPLIPLLNLNSPKTKESLYNTIKSK